jgi:response regulator RpfG family c-di-GMP phosphodiesterase
MVAKSLYTVLVVDDSPQERELISRALEQADIRADQAVDGVMAENMLRLRTYQAVITDLRMPRKHGYQLILDISALPTPPLIIAVTGVLEPRLVRDLIAKGVVAIESKPLNHIVLAAKVRAYIERSESSPEAPSTASGGREKVAASIEQAAGQLKRELADITQSFQATITALEKQQDLLEAGYLGSLRLLTNLVNNLGASTGSHAGRVEQLSAHIGGVLGLSRESLRHLRAAALLHEIGQFGMADSIRSTPPWNLSTSEREDYMRYPLIGAALLSEIPGAEEVADLVEAHMENYDGSGFPHAKQGKDIPLGARIIRIADALDTYRMHNQGDRGVTLAVQHLSERRGSFFDPRIVPIALAATNTVFSEEDSAGVSHVEAHQLAAGMVLAEDVFDEEGHFLTREGAVLTKTLARRLGGLLANRRIKIRESG